MDYNKKSLEFHKKLKGKIEVKSKVSLKTKEDLSLAYTPGVAEVSRKIAEDIKKVYDYTIKGNSVAVISDGSAVLGLGNLGAEAALPVMEGKAVLFKELAGIDAFPIVLKEQNIEKTISTIKNISPVFGGINLEDFKAPECFEIESQLQDLGIPVMHDDQHGTAVVVLAGLINSLKLKKADKKDVKIVVNGAGAAGIAIVKLLLKYGFKNILNLDSKGIIYKDRGDLNKYKKEIAEILSSACDFDTEQKQTAPLKMRSVFNKTGFSSVSPKPQQTTYFKVRSKTEGFGDYENKECVLGGLPSALKGADVFIGVSKAGVLKPEMIKLMNKKPVIFAMANPEPEINPDDAKKAGAFIVATGRSDFPNQVNNVLAFPGIFRGALDIKAKKITDEMKIAAAEALAELIEPRVDKILPEALDKSVVLKVANAVKRAYLV